MKQEKLLLQCNLQFFAKDGPGGEKTEEPTGKKIEDTRKEGQVALSRELTLAISLFGLFMSLKFLIPYIGKEFIHAFSLFYGKIDYYTENGLQVYNTKQLSDQILLSIIKIIFPTLVIGFVVALLATSTQIKFKFTTKPLMPKFSKMDPMKGLKRIVSGNSLVELLKSVLKIIFISYIAYSTLKDQIMTIFSFYDMSLNQALEVIGDIVINMGMKISLALLVIGFADLIYQKIKHKNEIKMPKQEVKDEMKNTEGDPQVKSQIKSKMRAASQRRMMQSVPKADVIITNPTHFAVALSYDADTSSAPVVVAKGADYLAGKIKELARENKIEIVENKPLARMLYFNVEIGMEIPPELYQSVAEVLAYVYNLKKNR